MSKVKQQFCLQCLYCTASFAKLVPTLEAIQIYCALVKSKLYLAFLSRFLVCKHRRTVDRIAVKKEERSANAGKKITHIISESVRRQRIIMLTVIVSHTCYN